MWMLPLIGSTASAISIMSLNTSNGASYCRKDFFVTSHCRAWRPMWPRAGRLSARHAARTTAQGPRSWNGRRRMNRSSRARTAHLRTRPFPDRRRARLNEFHAALGSMCAVQMCWFMLACARRRRCEVLHAARLRSPTGAAAVAIIPASRLCTKPRKSGRET